VITVPDRYGRTDGRHAISLPCSAQLHSALASHGSEMKNFTQYSPFADFSRPSVLNIHYY